MEPLLPKKKPFVISCIASAIGGGIIGFAGVKTYMMGGLGFFGLPAFIDGKSKSVYSLIWVLIGMAVAMVVAFVATYITYHDDAPQNDEAKIEKKGTKTAANQVIASPLTGEVKALEEVEDEAFSSGALGQGVAILPSEGKLYAPCATFGVNPSPSISRYPCPHESGFLLRHRILFQWHDRLGRRLLLRHHMVHIICLRTGE